MSPRPAWSGSTRRSRLPKDWPSRVAAVRKRDRDTCYVCKGKRCGNRSIQVDHIRRGDDHSLGNLACIGRSPCHAEKSSAEGHISKRPRRRPSESHPGEVR